MKNLLVLFMLVLTAAAANATPIIGVVYKNATEPGPYFSTVAPTKSGSAMCKSYFGIVAVGQCGIHDAAKNANITTITNYDIKRKNILGYQEITTIVYGR